jgi:hypothetical protein
LEGADKDDRDSGWNMDSTVTLFLPNKSFQNQPELELKGPTPVSAFLVVALPRSCGPAVDNASRIWVLVGQLQGGNMDRDHLTAEHGEDGAG